MSQPPQQPAQPGPYGPDPRHQQPAGPYGHQSGPGPAERFGQPPYGQQPGHYGQPGYPGGGPPKSRTGLIVAIVVLAVLVLGGGVTIFLLTQDGGPSNTASQDQTSQSQDPSAGDPTAAEDPTTGEDPGGGEGGTEEEMTEVALSYIDTITAQDAAAASEHVCGGDEPGALYDTMVGGGNVVTVGATELYSDTSGSIEIIIGENGDPLPTPMLFENGSWCFQY